MMSILHFDSMSIPFDNMSVLCDDECSMMSIPFDSMSILHFDDEYSF